MDSLYLFFFFTILLIPLLLPWSFSPIVAHHSSLLSLPALHPISTTSFSPPLSVIGKGWCTRIHLIKCTNRTQTQTILTDILLSCSKMNMCVDWITSHLSQDSLYLANVGIEREKGKQMKIKWKNSSEREKLIIPFACWCKPFQQNHVPSCCIVCEHIRTHNTKTEALSYAQSSCVILQPGGPAVFSVVVVFDSAESSCWSTMSLGCVTTSLHWAWHVALKCLCVYFCTCNTNNRTNYDIVNYKVELSERHAVLHIN